MTNTPGDTPDPQHGEQPSYPSEPYGQPPYGQPGYGQPGYGEQPGQVQPPYGQPAYGQPPYGQQPYGAPAPGYPAYGYAAAPKHPSATTAMVLGIIGLVGGFVCCLPMFASPFAWVMGARAVREIDASSGQLGGRSEANAGKIMGIIGTVLLILAVLALIAYIVVVAVAFESGEFDTGSDY